MSSNNKDRLAKISNEVSELHPILDKVLPKIPGVLEVEYTHGTNEMGADFVFSRSNPIFGFTEYVGVIAKVTAITQDHTQVERQIEECAVERYFQNGKQKIQIDEVWVVTTQNISFGAQRKINSKYVSRKVIFVDGDRLSTLIDNYLPSFWTDVDLEIGEYLSSFSMRIDEIDRRTSLIGLTTTDFYVEQEIHRKILDSEYSKIQRHKRSSLSVDIWHEVDQHKCLLIEGGMGCGKSKLLQRLSRHYSQPEVYLDKKYIPILIEYKNLMREFGGDIDSLIDTEIDPKLRKAADGAIFLVLIDGVDEKKSSADEQFEELSLLIDQINANPHVKAVITSRQLRIMRESDSFVGRIRRYEIQPLSLRKSIEFLRILCAELDAKSRILEDLKKSQLFKELPRSPIAAILLAKLLNESADELPSSMTELYAKYSEYMLGRWDIDKGLQSEREYEALDKLISNVARFMIDNELYVISDADVRTIFDSYLSDRKLNVTTDELFEKLSERCEFVVVDTHTHTFSFKHRTFAEFFYAKSVARTNDFVVDSRAFHVYWMNIYYFYLGLLKDCPDILQRLSSIKELSEAEMWLKTINMPNYLLAAYTTPYHVVVDVVTESIIETAELYKNITTGVLKSAFGHLSQMHILFISQLLVRSGYSYEFFTDALEESCLRIVCGDYEPDLKAYAVFFLTVAQMEIDDSKSFDFLLQELSSNLPIDLILALQHESKDGSERTKLMRKQDGRAKRILRSHGKEVAKLYDIPVQRLLGFTKT